jgi:hypothetical protein
MDPDKADMERSVATEGLAEARIQKEIDRLGKEMITTVERVFWNLDDDEDKEEVSSERARAMVKQTLYDRCGSERGDKPKWNQWRNAKPKKYTKSMQTASDFLEDVRTGGSRGSTKRSRTRSKRQALMAAKKAKSFQNTARARSPRDNSNPATDLFERYLSDNNTSLRGTDGTINISRQDYDEFLAWKSRQTKASTSRSRGNPSTPDE